MREKAVISKVASRRMTVVCRERIREIVFAIALCLSLFAARCDAQVDRWKLSAPVISGGAVLGYRISPDGRWVVYAAIQETPNAKELFSIPIEGGTAVRLNGPLPADTWIGDQWEITPDGSRVVYTAPQETLGLYELFSVPIEGPAAAATKLNKTLPPGARIGSPGLNSERFSISPDSRRVIYQADQDEVDTFELYSVPVEGPASAGVKLNPPLVTGGDVTRPQVGGFSAQISPDSRRVIYFADQETNETFEIFSVPIEGPPSAAVKLNGPLPPGGDLEFGFGFSPDGSRLVYLGEQLQAGVRELFSVPIAGPSSGRVKLSGELTAGGDAGLFRVSPDGSRVVYRADQDSDEVLELYSVGIAGPFGSAVKISKPLAAGQDVLMFRFTPDGQRVIYSAGVLGDDIKLLFSTPVAGPASSAVELMDPSVGLPASFTYDISPDGRWVVYRARENENSNEMVFSVRSEGPRETSERISNTGLTLGTVRSYEIAPGSGGIVYRQITVGFGSVPNTDHLYYTTIRNSGFRRVRLNPGLVVGGDVVNHSYSPDGQHVVYSADQETDDVRELYAAKVPRAAVRHWERYR